MEKWKNIEPGMWKPEKQGDNIIGILVNKEPKDEDAGISARYYLENQEGMFFVWGCAVLDDRMQYVKPGARSIVASERRQTARRTSGECRVAIQLATGTVGSSASAV